MNTYNNALVVGAGGIACQLMPGLTRLMNVILVDGDNYEPKNVERQFPALQHTGNKAVVLKEMLKRNTTRDIIAVPEYVKATSFLYELRKGIREAEAVDLIIACVDNNKARNMLLTMAEEEQLPLILGGNEHQHGEAHLYLPEWYDPRDYHEFPENEPAPYDCNADATVEEFPQTPLANIMASSAIFHILLSLRSTKNRLNTICHSVLDTTFSKSQRIRDCQADEARATIPNDSHEHPRSEDAGERSAARSRDD